VIESNCEYIPTNSIIRNYYSDSSNGVIPPPFHKINQYGNAYIKFYDYIFVDTESTINLSLLITQIFLVSSIGFFLYLLFNKRNTK